MTRIVRFCILIPMTERNSQCPCGSGKKYKKCCLIASLPRDEWTPFVKAPKNDPNAIRQKALEMSQKLNHPIDEAYIENLVNREAKSDIYLNNLYQVNRYDEHPEVIWLSIKRLDKSPVHDWRHLQRIKNELVGAEHEAIEIYPSESRLVDTANQYHLWVFKDATYRIPLGFNEGRLTANADAAQSVGAKQREFSLSK